VGWRGGRGGDSEGNLINVQYKPIWNCHNELPRYNEYILILNIGKKSPSDLPICGTEKLLGKR
jgi:hypothetical protein